MDNAPSFGLNLSGLGSKPKYDPTPLGFEPAPKKKKDSCWARHHRVWVSTSVGLSFFVVGMTTSSLGIIVVEYHNKFSAGWFGLSFVFLAQTLGHILGSVSASLTMDKFSFSAFRANCFFLATVGTALATVPFMDQLWKLLMVIVFMGVGIGWVETTGNKTLMGLYADRVDIFMQSVHIAFGIGAVCGPWLFKLTVFATGQYQWAIWIISALVILSTLMSLIVAFGDLPDDTLGILAINAVGVRPQTRVAHSSGTRPWQQNIVIFVCSLILFFFGVSHQFLSAWLYRYAQTFGFAPADSYVILSIYWGAFTFTRVLMKLINYVTPTFYGFFCLFGCVLAFFFLTVPIFQTKFTLWILVALIGLFLSGVFPSMLAIPTEFFVWVRAPDSWFFSLVIYIGYLSGPLGISLAWLKFGDWVVSWILLFGSTVAFMLLVILFLFVALSSTMQRHIVIMNRPFSYKTSARIN